MATNTTLRTSSLIHHGKRCVAGGPGGVSCGNSQHTPGISIHHFPDKKKDPGRFNQWVRFVRRHRPNWNPQSGQTILCGIHFEDCCFNVKKDIASSLGIQLRLNKDAVPTIDVANVPLETDDDLGAREKRKVNM